MATNNVLNLGFPVSVANGGTGAVSLTDNAILIGNGTGAIAEQALTDGQLLIGTTGGAPAAATLTAGTGIDIVEAAGSITISGTIAGLDWAEETGTTVALAAGDGVIANNASLVTATLPSTAAVGAVFAVTYKGAGGWRVAQNAGQSIVFGTSTSTSGAGGYIESTAVGDTVFLLCITTDTVFQVTGAQGNLTVA